MKQNEPTHIRVTAPPGRLTPIHPSDGYSPEGGQLTAQPGTIIRVRWSQSVRRAVTRGDLVPCDMNGARVELALASCPVDLDGGRIILPAAKDER